MEVSSNDNGYDSAISFYTRVATLILLGNQPKRRKMEREKRNVSHGSKMKKRRGNKQ
jgi:hypothetical protein